MARLWAWRNWPIPPPAWCCAHHLRSPSPPCLPQLLRDRARGTGWNAARIDGAGFFTSTAASSSLVAADLHGVFIWQFTQIWNDFLFGVVFGGSTRSRSRWR